MKKKLKFTGITRLKDGKAKVISTKSWESKKGFFSIPKPKMKLTKKRSEDVHILLGFFGKRTFRTIMFFKSITVARPVSTLKGFQNLKRFITPSAVFIFHIYTYSITQKILGVKWVLKILGTKVL
ncbi:MAG: hypothetical protein A2163_07745 [Actinobacteria bacterium RBG_13_35_12]|nr:MAG: hypothetical protein A2163_07745 [Actinobacteria bacterium RBG_13_35_12]